MDWLKLRELSLKREQYADIKKEIQAVDKEYSDFIDEVKKDFGDMIISHLVSENQIFDCFRVSRIVCNTNHQLVEVVLKYKDYPRDYGVYFIVTHNNILLRIPVITDEKVTDWGLQCLLFFQQHPNHPASLNITSIQKAWDLVCEKYKENFDILVKEASK